MSSNLSRILALSLVRVEWRHPHRRALTHSRRLSSQVFLNEYFSLEGRSALITGGGTGIGASLAMGLARAGASVVLTARRHRVLEETCEKIQKQLLRDGYEDVEKRANFYPCDVTDLSQIPALIREAEYVSGIPPTILINNAGANIRKPVIDVLSTDFHESFELMITAPFMISRALTSNMKDQKYGRIINLASLQSFAAFRDSVSYASAKSGILGLTRAMSEAFSPHHGYEGVTVNAIAPGYVQTDLTAKVFADTEYTQRLAEKTILKRNSVPQDLVGATVFLSSPAAAYVTGQTLLVDGGFTALGLR